MFRLRNLVIVAAVFVVVIGVMPWAGQAAEIQTPQYLQAELEKLNPVPQGTWVAISKQNFKLFVMDGWQVVREYGVAVGKNVGNKQKVGDNRTPEGMFEVQQVQDATSWTHDFRDGKGAIKGAYGPWFIRLKTGWKGIGIHGTHDPASIGTNATEGCIRLKNGDVAELKEKYIKVGMNVLILQ